MTTNQVVLTMTLASTQTVTVYVPTMLIDAELDTHETVSIPDGVIAESTDEGTTSIVGYDTVVTVSLGTDVEVRE